MLRKVYVIRRGVSMDLDLRLRESRYKLSNMARGTILLVDADSDLAQIVSSYLNYHGFRVHYCNRVRDAVGKLSLQRYSAVFIDPNLEGERGDTVLLAASDPAGLNSGTPFVVMSESLDYGLPAEAIGPIRSIVQKPFDLEDALSALQGVLQPGV